jgi:hypothetical protein
MNFYPVLMTAVTKNDVANASDFWTSQFSSFTPATVLVTLAFALVTGILISLVYKITYRGVLYSPQFSMVLIMLTLVTAPVVMAIGSSVTLSMGMVGALSIVRFRTAVKEPLDTCYMFWAITMGILLGAKQYAIALVVAVGIGGILIALSFIHFRNPNAYLLVIHYDEGAEPDIESELRRGTHSRRIRSKTVTRGGAEMTVEVRLDNRSDIVGHMLDIAGVHDATLVACQNETGA